MNNLINEYCRKLFSKLNNIQKRGFIIIDIICVMLLECYIKWGVKWSYPWYCNKCGLHWYVTSGEYGRHNDVQRQYRSSMSSEPYEYRLRNTVVDIQLVAWRICTVLIKESSHCQHPTNVPNYRDMGSPY